MTKEELLQRLREIEWDDFEVKEASGGLPKSMWETVSAFSNTAGGWIILGVKEFRDEIGSSYIVCGVSNAEKMEQDLTSILRSTSKFNVPVLARIERFDFEGDIVFAVYVPPSNCKPVYINNNLSNTFIRVGSGDQRATDIEIGILLREKTFGSKSEMVVEGTSLDDLNANSMETYRRRLQSFNPELEFNALGYEDFCERTGISDNGSLTFGGLLMFGSRKSITKHFRLFWIDYREIPGTSYDDAEVRYTYRMPEQENIWEYFQMLIQRLRSFADNPFMPGPDGFSPEDNSQLYSLREGLINMLAHADYFGPMHSSITIYNDKIEFQNPGQFPVSLTGNIKKIKSIPRNPNIIMFFRYARLAENAGYGIGRIKKWESLTGEKVEIESDIATSTITYFRPIVGQKMGQKMGQKDLPTRERLLNLISENPKITRKELVAMLNVPSSTIQFHIEKLKLQGRLERIGGARGGYWKVLI